MSEDEDGIGGGSGMGGIQSLGIVNALKTGDSKFQFFMHYCISSIGFCVAAAAAAAAAATAADVIVSTS